MDSTDLGFLENLLSEMNLCLGDQGLILSSSDLYKDLADLLPLTNNTAEPGDISLRRRVSQRLGQNIRGIIPWRDFVCHAHRHSCPLPINTMCWLDMVTIGWGVWGHMSETLSKWFSCRELEILNSFLLDKKLFVLDLDTKSFMPYDKKLGPEDGDFLLCVKRGKVWFYSLMCNTAY